MTTDFSEVERVLHALELLSSRFEKLMKSQRSGVASLEALVNETTELKAHIKDGRKRSTIDGAKLPRSNIEQRYYSKAIQDASSNFTLRADVSPNNPKWSAGLFAVRSEVDYQLNRLKKDYPLCKE